MTLLRALSERLVKELVVDIAEWVLSNQSGITELAEKYYKSKDDEKILTGYLKTAFEASRQTGFILSCPGKNDKDETVAASENKPNRIKVIVPTYIASFFSFLSPKIDGKFKSANELVMEEPHTQATLSLFKQLLCMYYRYCQLNGIGNFYDIDGANDEQLICSLNKLLLEEFKEDIEQATDLLHLAHIWNLESLFQAVGRVFSSLPEEKRKELAKSFPHPYLPFLARNVKNNPFVACLLSDMLEAEIPVAEGTIAECMELFSDNLSSYTKAEQLVSPVKKSFPFKGLNGRLQELFKQKLLKEHPVSTCLLLAHFEKLKLKDVEFAWR